LKGEGGAVTELSPPNGLFPFSGVPENVLLANEPGFGAVVNTLGAGGNPLKGEDAFSSLLSIEAGLDANRVGPVAKGDWDAVSEEAAGPGAALDEKGGEFPLNGVENPFVCAVDRPDACGDTGDEPFVVEGLYPLGPFVKKGVESELSFADPLVFIDVEAGDLNGLDAVGGTPFCVT
jgi:hypothetical protein